MTDLLVIGYGNDLRRDDGAGRLVADAIEELAMPDVLVCSVPQLSPELTLEIAGASRVVFVDASVDATQATMQPVTPGDGGGGVMTHHGDPARLLSLTTAVGALPMEAYVISIPARNLELGSELSDATAAGADEAIDMIVALATSNLDTAD